MKTELEVKKKTRIFCDYKKAYEDLGEAIVYFILGLVMALPLGGLLIIIADLNGFGGWTILLGILIWILLVSGKLIYRSFSIHPEGKQEILYVEVEGKKHV